MVIKLIIGSNIFLHKEVTQTFVVAVGFTQIRPLKIKL
jgi:hypothetical protein